MTDACEELISRCADAASQPVQTFIKRCAAFRASKEMAASESSSASSPPEQEFASPANVLQVDTDFRESCDKAITAWLARLHIYLEDDKTISILVAPLKVKVMQLYGSFRDLIGTEYAHEVADGMLSQVDLGGFLDRICTEHSVPQLHTV